MNLISNLSYNKNYFILLLILILQWYNVLLVKAVSDQPLLLLISLDGLNHRHVNAKLTPNIWRLATDGVFAAKGITVQFTTVTASNHHCIVTGLYQESHGIVDNTFYDPVFKEHFDIWNFWSNKSRADNSLASKWYQGGEPIWLTNMKRDGRMSGTYLWPMGEALLERDGILRHRTKPYSNYSNAEKMEVLPSEIDELLHWFVDEKQPINLGLYYNSEPDHTQHKNDLWGHNVTEKLKEVDSLIGRLIEKSKQLGIFDKLNIILTADHGHSTVKSQASTFNLSGYINKERVINSSYSFFPRRDLGASDEEVYANLSRAVRDGLPVQVFRKSEFPSRYHWVDNRRIGENILIHNYNHEDASKDKQYPHGTHGYFNEYPDMNAFFVAHGPAFKRGYVVETDYIENIDIYPLMCHVLGVQPAAHNGSFDRISIILRQNDGDKFLHNAMIVWFIIFSVIVPFFATFFYCVGFCCCCSTNAVASASDETSTPVGSKYEKLRQHSGSANFDANVENGKTKRSNVAFNSLNSERYGSSNDEL